MCPDLIQLIKQAGNRFVASIIVGIDTIYLELTLIDLMNDIM